MSISNAPIAALLIIGNEILSGRTQDINLVSIAKKLASIGIPLKEVRVVPDTQADIVEALNALRSQYTYVFTTGGIGPTHDDITVDAVAAAFDVPVIEDPTARALLAQHYKPQDLTPARLRMARIPLGASLIANPVSTAPGMKIENVYVLAGVPHIMQAMMDGVVSTLRHGPMIYSMTVSALVAESTIAEELGALALRYPEIDIGSYPWVRQGKFGTALVARGTDKEQVDKVVEEISGLIRAKGLEPSLLEE